jgi:uncharacterized protein DUF3800
MNNLETKRPNDPRRISRTAADCIRLIQIVVPKEGFLFVPFEVYFDESYNDRGVQTLCVAGFMFTQRNAIKLTKEWNYLLGLYRMPYFRMSQCAHGNGPFAELTKDKRIELEKKLIGTINRFATAGFATTLNEKEFGGAMTELFPDSGPYSWAVRSCLDGIAEYNDRTQNREDISYFFESGHRDQSEANRVMNKIFDDPISRRMFRYKSHAFIDKVSSAPVQAADLLAWQWYTDKRHIAEGKPRRKDCAALLRKIFYLTAHVSSEILVETIARRQRDGTLFRQIPNA